MSANNESEQSDDYELYSPLGSREETRTGKGFLVRSDQSQCAVISPMLSVCWCCTGTSWTGLHGQELQKQTQGHEDICLSDPHQAISPGDRHR